MKTLKNLTLALVATATLVACDNSKKDQAQKNVDAFSNYVDSVSVVSTENLNANWEEIERVYTEKKLQAQSDVETTDDSGVLKSKLNEANSKYTEFKDKHLASSQELVLAKNKMTFRNTFFKGQEIGDDMSFAWVNKDNILSVYDTFVTTAIENKDSYSREDWDEIKMMYEALDSRKNTVEKEGLSSSDNLKIASLKVKFAPTYTIKRTGAKTEENAEAKK
ncbi:hypothetical protein ACFSX9_00145 [Flavobacterium ardleyense]|uniref:Lipoprotein n=1 Tax=Flavobacterium ardleyense TaxID=2038737 RepID=A0ABW5Z304_9FLAO